MTLVQLLQVQIMAFVLKVSNVKRNRHCSNLITINTKKRNIFMADRYMLQAET